MKPVRKLPSEVCSLVRSGVVIPTPSRAVVELVLNSIDAEATSIAVRVDLRLFKIQVIDNGHGVTLEDLEAIGNRSVTSKCYSLDEFYNNLMFHGYRGEYLASLREMCGLLEIVTHSSDGDNTYSKLFVHGKEEKVKVSDLKRPTHGTTVTVTDFMFNMPVRRERMKDAVELEAIRSCIECIALAHPEISVSVRNDAKGRIILEKHKSSDLLNAFEHLYGHNLARTLAAINFSTEKFKIRGYISREAYRHNDLQFIYVNRQSIIKTKLHKLVVALLSKSSIIRSNGPWKNKPIPKNVPVERWLSFPSLEKQKRYPVFVINIICQRNEYEMCWDDKKPLIYFKDWEGILACVSNALQEFLRLENLVEEEDSNNQVIEEETRNYASTVHQGTSHSVLLPLETSLKNSPQIDFEVATWNIQGAVHGICAKRPKENKTIPATVICEENDNLKSGSTNEVRKQFVTPDTIDLNKEYMQSEQESVPPVVKFLGKYETPPADRLQITKGAYRLKQREEEERKLKIAEKLGKFKCASKAKLTSIKNVQKGKSSHYRSFPKEKTKGHISLKLSTEDIKNGKRLFNDRVVNSSDTCLLTKERQDELFPSGGEPQDQVIDMGIPENRSHVSEDIESSVIESDVSNCVRLSPLSNDCTRTTVDFQQTSDISGYTSEQTQYFVDSNQPVSGIICRSKTGQHLFCGLDDTDEPNNQTNENVHKFIVKSFNACRHPSCPGKMSGRVLSNKTRVSFLTHSNPFNMKEHHGNENGEISCGTVCSKPCAKLGISETMVVSIPTPQPENISASSVTSSLCKDKFDSSIENSRIDYQLQVSENYKKHICSPEMSTSLNAPQSYDHNNSRCQKPNAAEKLFACDFNEHIAPDHITGQQNTLKCISPSLVTSSVDETLKDSFNLPCSDITPVSYFSNMNRVEDNLYLHRMEKHLNMKQGHVLHKEKVQHFKNMFESFEKCVTHNVMEGRSPYFTLKNNSVHCKETKKSYSFELGNSRNKQSKVVENCNSAQNIRQEENCDGLLSMLGTSEINRQRELFSDLHESDENSNKRNVRPLFNFSFSECSPMEISRTFAKNLRDIQTGSTAQAKTSDVEPSVLITQKQTVENLNDEADSPKRRRMSKDKYENLSKNEENTTSNNNEKTEELSKKYELCDSSKCGALEHKQINMCEQTVSISQNHEQYRKETINTPDKILDNDWLELRNFEGKLFYFHAPSGFTTYNAPSFAKDASLYSMSKRCQFLPKGMSPLLAVSTTLHCNSKQQSDSNGTSKDTLNWMRSSTDNDDLKTVKWRDKPDMFNNDITDVLNIAKALPDKRILSSNTTIPDLSFISAKMSGLLLQQKFDKRIFANIRVVGQLDNKFIITLCSLDKNSSPHILGIFDQHAVHERIRLEALMKEYSSDEDEWSFRATDLNERIVLTVSSKESHIMGSFQCKFQKLGLHFAIMDQDNIEIHKIPTCLYTRFLRERSSQWLEGILHVLIQDVVLFLIKTGGQDSVVPEVFKDVINSEACKGAIKFGDSLSVVQCEDLLSLLSTCDLPFYCAHGRPSFMPVLDLRQFEMERRKYVPGY